jgi:hypothetical protein
MRGATSAWRGLEFVRGDTLQKKNEELLLPCPGFQPSEPVAHEGSGNEGKTGTEIKIRKAGRQERTKTSNSKPQASAAQTPIVAGDDDDIYLFITRDQRDGR